jgi:hypothetical protein
MQTDYSSQMPVEIKHPGKCPAHNFWMKKGQCELCRIERDKLIKHYESLTGSNKPTIKIGILFDK